MEVWNNPANYKPCYKKQYDIWACIPPKGTIIVSKLEQPESVARLGGRTYFTGEMLAEYQRTNNPIIGVLKELLAQKGVYCTEAGTVVLSGTRGELWTTSIEKLQATYQFYANDQLSYNWASLFERRGAMVNGEPLLPWIKVHSNGKQAQPTMACFVEKSQKGLIKTRWATLAINAPLGKGGSHGLGDFVVCEAVMVGGKLKPAIGADGSWNRWVVNGAVFADTYNNQGWANMVSPQTDLVARQPDNLFEMPSKDADKDKFDQRLFEKVFEVAQRCASMQHHELKFNAFKGGDSTGGKPNEIYIEASTIMDFAKKNSSSEFRTVGVSTKVVVNPNNTVTFTNWLIGHDGSNSKKPMFQIQLPNGSNPKGDTVPVDETLRALQGSAEVVFGLCGFVREVGVRSSFTVQKPGDVVTKGDYDGIRDYTMTSGATNRKLRGLKWYDNEQHGEGLSSAVRTIANCDRLFDKVVTSRPLRVFRGEPYEERTEMICNQCRCSFSDLRGMVSVNTAYSSTTLNVQSAPMFAKSRGEVSGIKGGIIWAIDLPERTRAFYAHNSAGWKQQYEILLDRCYDLRCDGVLLEFRDSDNCVYKVLQGSLQPHQELGQLDALQSKPLTELGKICYNRVGRVDFEKEYSDGILHEAFNKIRERGYSDIQWQREWDSTKEVLHDGSDNKPAVNTLTTAQLSDKKIKVGGMIVMRANNPDTDKLGVHIDYGFRLSDDGRALIIHRLKGKTSMRQNHGDAEDLRWSEYGVDRFKFDNEYAEDGTLLAVHGATDINEFDQSLYDKSGRDKRNIIRLTTGTSDEIASEIINWAKRHKNVCLLPLIDVGRYFDTTFAQVLNEEGYELMRSIRVERHYDKSNLAQVNDAQAGYVPCKYQITGDNDDHLVIDVKFERDKGSGKLKISYRGQSQGTKVNESKSLSVDIFTGEHMYNLSKNIIYTFAKRMHLSKARKFDNLLNYFCYQRGYSLGRARKKGEGVLVNYRVWTPGDKSNFNVDVIKQDAENHQIVIEFDENDIKFIDMDFSNTIYSLYQQFCAVVCGDGQNVDVTQP